MIMRFHSTVVSILTVFATVTLHAEDTLRISVVQADSLFLGNNLSLLAAGLNIEMSKAMELQARLYPNPTFTADLNFYDPDAQRFFHIGQTGQKAFQLEQLILLGGKRRTLIDIARSERAIAELEFGELLLRLRFELRSSFYRLDQLYKIIDRYDNQMKQLRVIIDAYGEQVSRGNLPAKDAVRLKGVYINLNGQKSEFIREFTDELVKLQLLLQTDRIIVPLVSSDDIAAHIRALTASELTETAMNNRPDYRQSQIAHTLAGQQYLLEKRMRIPDLGAFVAYDQRGGAFNNQLNAGVALPLPLWNRNQGSIRRAELEVRQRALEQEQTALRVKIEVSGYLSLYNRAVKDYYRVTELYNEDFELTLNGMSDNFRNGNIGLIEFVDFFESYNEAVSDLAQVSIQLAVAAEQLSYITGKELF